MGGNPPADLSKKSLHHAHPPLKNFTRTPEHNGKLSTAASRSADPPHLHPSFTIYTTYTHTPLASQNKERETGTCFLSQVGKRCPCALELGNLGSRIPSAYMFKLPACREGLGYVRPGKSHIGFELASRPHISTSTSTSLVRLHFSHSVSTMGFPSLHIYKMKACTCMFYPIESRF